MIFKNQGPPGPSTTAPISLESGVGSVGPPPAMVSWLAAEPLLRGLHLSPEQELEIQRLKGQLAEAQAAAADGLIAGEALVQTEDAAAAEQDDGVSDELLASLHRQIEQQKEELAAARIQLELAGAQQDYQRELQAKSLKVLHQQLELARETSAAVRSS